MPEEGQVETVWDRMPEDRQVKRGETGRLNVDKLRGALIKKKMKFSSYIRKFRVEQLQSHI